MLFDWSVNVDLFQINFTQQMAYLVYLKIVFLSSAIKLKKTQNMSNFFYTLSNDNKRLLKFYIIYDNLNLTIFNRLSNNNQIE
jgi:hypothetical protein